MSCHCQTIVQSFMHRRPEVRSTKLARVEHWPVCLPNASTRLSARSPSRYSLWYFQHGVLISACPLLPCLQTFCYILLCKLIFCGGICLNLKYNLYTQNYYVIYMGRHIVFPIVVYLYVCISVCLSVRHKSCPLNTSKTLKIFFKT